VEVQEPVAERLLNDEVRQVVGGRKIGEQVSRRKRRSIKERTMSPAYASSQ